MRKSQLCFPLLIAIRRQAFLQLLSDQSRVLFFILLMRNLLWGYQICQIHPEQKISTEFCPCSHHQTFAHRGHNKHTLRRLLGRVCGLAGLLGEYPLQLVSIGKWLVAFVHGKLYHTPTHMRATVMNCSHISFAFHAKS